MRVCDLSTEAIKEGLRIKSLKSDRRGTVAVDPLQDCNCNVLWDAFGNEPARWGGAWPDNDCECEVVLDDNGSLVYEPERLPNPSVYEVNSNLKAANIVNQYRFLKRATFFFLLTPSRRLASFGEYVISIESAPSEGESYSIVHVLYKEYTGLKTTLEDWRFFKTKINDVFGIEVSDEYMPDWLKND